MKIYAGNLSTDVTEEDLREAFQAYGKLDSVSLVKDKSNPDLSRGFAFVEMSVQSEAQAAIDGLHGKMLKGKAMKVSEARPARA